MSGPNNPTTNGPTVQFSRGIPPPEAIPARELTEHTAAVLDELGASMFQYSPIGRHLGDATLRAHLGTEHGVDPDHILVTNGSLQALDLVAGHLLGGASPVVFVEGSTYDRAAGIFERHGARLVSVPMASDGLELDALRGALRTQVPDFLYTIPDFQNPSGVTLSQDKRHELLELAVTYGFTVIEDIPYRELRYYGEAPAGLWETPSDARVITIGSLSKVVSPGLRIGYVISDADTARALAARSEGIYLSPVPLCQAVAARALGSGLVRANIERVRDLLRPKHDSAVEVTKGLLGDALMAVPNGGYYVGVALRIDSGEQEFVAAARERGLALIPGSGVER